MKLTDKERETILANALAVTAGLGHRRNQNEVAPELRSKGNQHAASESHPFVGAMELSVHPRQAAEFNKKVKSAGIAGVQYAESDGPGYSAGDMLATSTKAMKKEYRRRKRRHADD